MFRFMSPHLLAHHISNLSAYSILICILHFLLPYFTAYISLISQREFLYKGDVSQQNLNFFLSRQLEYFRYPNNQKQIIKIFENVKLA